MYSNVLLEASPQIPEEGMIIEVQEGDNFYLLTSYLNERNMGPDRIWNRVIAWRFPELTKVKTAEYLVEPGMTYREILQLITTGHGVQYSIQFLEGWTMNQILDELSQHKGLIKDIELDVNSIHDLLGTEQSNPEGWLFADTYHYHRGMKVSDLILQMYERMSDELEAAWNNRSVDNQLTTPYELLIMASLIEKETGLSGERDEVSGVFHRRLAIGMRLQTDPTIIYALGDSYDGDIKWRDKKFQSPYNTYVVHGLPPTPIAVPSRASLIAAGNPAPGTALYFVAKGDGSHVFSDTLEQHNQAVREYLLQLKKDKNKNKN